MVAPLAVVSATVVGVVVSAVWYAIAPASTTGTPDAAASPPSPVAQALAELVRSGLVAALVAGLVAAGDWATVAQGMALGLALWILPVVLLAGSVIHEGTPIPAAIVHAGDWLAKLLAMGAVVGAIA